MRRMVLNDAERVALSCECRCPRLGGVRVLGLRVQAERWLRDLAAETNSRYGILLGGSENESGVFPTVDL